VHAPRPDPISNQRPAQSGRVADPVARTLSATCPVDESRDMDRAEVVDLAAFLQGAWRVERDIVDQSGPSGSGAFTGRATFTPDDAVPGLLRYVEQGTVELGTHRGPAFRHLAYHLDGPRAQVRFDDGRHFHDLDLRTGVWEVFHPCRADLYHGRFEVDDHHRWHQRWTVTGPRKHHHIVTVLVREPPRPHGG
jgi:hypothetical protein